ncbi:hypothetical protein BGZ72_004631, partial [Mortierella alpina]
MSRVPSSLDRVFSVPELAESVAQYLRPRELLALSTISRTLHHAFPPSLALSLPCSSDPSTPDRSLDTLASIAPRVRTLNLTLHVAEKDLAQQQWLSDVVYSHYTTVQQVHIEYWGSTIGEMEELLLRLSSVQKLSIVFKATINAAAIFTALIARRKAIAEQGSLDDAEAKLGCRYSVLRHLSISHQADFGLVQALHACPELRTLEMKEMSLSIHQDSVPATESAEAELVAMSSMKTLKLTRCTLSETQLSALDRLFPNLSDLEVSGCGGTWHLAIAGNHQSTASAALTGTSTEGPIISKVLFPELRRLVLWLEQVPIGTRLWGLVEGRPHLNVLETDIISNNRDELFRFARYCSEEKESAPRSPHIVDSMAALNNGAQSSTAIVGAQSKWTDLIPWKTSTTPRPRHRFKRLAVQTYVFPPLTAQELEQFYGVLAFRELEYGDLSMPMIPYAKTLTSLHLGGPKEDISTKEFVRLKQILRKLPRLEILKIDRYLDSFEIFQGLGREPLSSSTDMNGGNGAGPSSLGHIEWLGEAPFLTLLDISLRLPWTTAYSPAVMRTWTVDTGIRRVSFLNLEELQMQVLDRFRFLEDVTVRLLGRSQPASETLSDWDSKRNLSARGGH